MKLLKLTEFIDKYFHQGELMIYMGSSGGGGVWVNDIYH